MGLFHQLFLTKIKKTMLSDVNVFLNTNMRMNLFNLFSIVSLFKK